MRERWRQKKERKLSLIPGNNRLFSSLHSSSPSSLSYNFVLCVNILTADVIFFLAFSFLLHYFQCASTLRNLTLILFFYFYFWVLNIYIKANEEYFLRCFFFFYFFFFLLLLYSALLPILVHTARWLNKGSVLLTQSKAYYHAFVICLPITWFCG